MLGEKILGQDASYLRRLGVLCSLLCGVAAILGVVTLCVSPAADIAWATALAMALAACGVLLARR